MIKREDQQITMVPIDQITVLNPRTRGRTKFKQIVESIGRIGLKKPITVARNDRNLSKTEYLLVCGQGRLEAFKALGEEKIPAIVINGTKEDFLLVSLVENLARRQHSCVELVNEIRNLKDRGYTYSQISKKIDLAPSYVEGILVLLNKGEEKLIRAVEKGKIPITTAIIIARSDGKAIQKALTEAYENKTLRGKQLMAARRLITDRKLNGNGDRSGPQGKRISSEEILQTYQRETQRQRIVIQKARIAETRLLFAVSAVRQLFQDENFVTLLRAESLDTLPQFLAEKTLNQEKDP
ncbi:MAG TPA: plasmid partitioning protein RepB C-terminal domain-containing protein [Planctomicrobium sp.]|nr:plasmid partitioning protein RepB C-terminal domain-containing protein [Planctomicrobium sp.]